MDSEATPRTFVMDDGVTIAADTWGDPGSRPVLLAHGGGQTRHAWGKTASVLAANGWHAIAYDHRGHGQSQWSPDGNYTLDRFARDQHTIAKHFTQPPVLVGASLGGLSAMLAQGEIDPAIYSAVILVDITPKMNQEGALNIMRFMSANMDDGFASLDEAADIVAAYTQRERSTNTGGLAKNLRLDADGRYRWHWDPAFMQLRNDPGGGPSRLVRAVQSINAPLLLVRGRMSELVTEEIAQDFLSLVPNAAYVDVEHARHMVAGDRNDIFTAAVLDFLQQRL